MNPKEQLFKALYWYISSADKDAEVLFMNYGYSNPCEPVDLEEADKLNRYPIQLYHHQASEVDIKNRDVVEIGCGRGGGLSYVTRRFSPASALGIDLDRKAVEFCKGHYKQPRLSFSQGDAQSLSTKNNTFDVVLNVESSHRYPQMDVFLEGVHRILRPGGHFLLTDFRCDYEMPELTKQLKSCKMSVLKEELITPNVVDALEKDDVRRRDLINRLAPWFLRGLVRNFAGTVGSETYHRLVTGKYVYFNYVLQRQ